LCGSSDLYEQSGRRPYASINFITAHDGFSLHDLVSYNHKHNERNGESNRDGENHNLSWNCGVEGPTDNRGVQVLRERQKRNLLATLLLSQGVPMIRSGDEIGHTQGGNNNAYCQDNDISWLNWELSPEQQDLCDFVSRTVAIWRGNPVFQRRRFFQGRQIRGEAVKDIAWLTSSGEEMTDDAWRTGLLRCLGMRLNGDMMNEVDERGRPIVGNTVIMLLNANEQAIPFTLPTDQPHEYWRPILDTALPRLKARWLPGGFRYDLQGRSLAVLQLIRIWPKFVAKIWRWAE
jgi:glycogen operon protein